MSTYTDRYTARVATMDRGTLVRRAEELRAEQVQRLFSALSRRIRAAFASRGPAPEKVFIPRSPSSAIF